MSHFTVLSFCLFLKVSCGKNDSSQGKAGLTIAQPQQILQTPPLQVLVIERMHSGKSGLYNREEFFFHQNFVITGLMRGF